MAGKKNQAVVAVIGNLTTNQAAQISKDIMKAKNKYAPGGRGTIAAIKKEQIGSLLQKGIRRIGR